MNVPNFIVVHPIVVETFHSKTYLMVALEEKSKSRVSPKSLGNRELSGDHEC